MNGKLPQRIYAIVLEWAAQHREELIKDWELAREAQPLNKIEPLV